MRSPSPTAKTQCQHVPDQGSLPFSLTKPMRLPLSLAHCRDMGSCRLPPPSSRLSYSRHPSRTTSFIADLHHCPSCPHRSMWIFLYFFAPHVPVLASTVFAMSSLCACGAASSATRRCTCSAAQSSTTRCTCGAA